MAAGKDSTEETGAEGDSCGAVEAVQRRATGRGGGAEIAFQISHCVPSWVLCEVVFDLLSISPKDPERSLFCSLYLFVLCARMRG